jgi:hypothetical protein
MGTPLYIETTIAGPIGQIWDLTQTPALHARWDLRFSTIEYLPRPAASQPQRFRYTTRLGFGLKIVGMGETFGDQDPPGGQRTSALQFWSDDPKSLIRSGSGYWKYTPVAGGVRFATQYDYEVRFGALGRAFDTLVFRPLMGWATAWSFDCLRLWVEQGIPPEVQVWRSLVRVATLGWRGGEVPQARRCARTPGGR